MQRLLLLALAALGSTLRVGPLATPPRALLRTPRATPVRMAEDPEELEMDCLLYTSPSPRDS